jgi:UDP-N-acetyl-D-mannosaminuronic acid dehydrogenase
MVKLVENSYRDVNIAFANELSMICDDLGLNVWKVIEIANCHPRVKILRPGPGVGGHCIAVDPWFIVEKAPQTARLLRTAREVNNAKVGYVIKRVEEAMRRAVKKKSKPVIACFGLTYKADTDDTRESPSIEIVHRLAERNLGQLVACDPYVESIDIKGVSFDKNATALAARADIIVFLVPHKEFGVFRSRKFGGKAVVDACGLLTQTA